MKHFVLSGILLLAGLLLISGCQPATARNGDTVQVDYTAKLTDGTVVDSSVGQEPLEFTLGEGQMISGFEKAVLGMRAGESKMVTIPATEAYGNYRKDLVMEVPRTELPEGLTPQVGQKLQGVDNIGRVTVFTVTAVSESTVTVDANHFLAGKDLVFEIKLLSIK